MSDKPLVVITGVTGYLGSVTCLTFLKEGAYHIRGTVRDKNNESKIGPLRHGFGEYFNQLELVEADLNNEQSLSAACKGATYVIHTASPFHFKGDCVGPAVAGTNAVMKACTEHQVKMCVITSSCAAIQGMAKADAPKPPAMYDESCWSNPDRPEGLIDYMKSKTLAEKAAWDYQKANPGFDIVTINPCFIMGPSPSVGDGFSVGWISQILNGSKSEVARGTSGFVDVRDVALAHLKAIQIPEAKNKRFILYNVRTPMPDVYKWLSAFNDKGMKVPTKLADGSDDGGDLIDNTRSREVLKIDYTPMEKTFRDHAEQLIADGLVKMASSSL